MVPLSFAGHEFDIVAPAALFWRAQNALLVADLHLEKASFYARQGQMLPPYDSLATLDELAGLITKTEAQKVFCLGDNYHDYGGEERLESRASSLLQNLTRETEWVWISGNHDRNVTGLWGGRVMGEWSAGGLVLRHEASENPERPEVSGHYHPKCRVQVRGRILSRRCFVKGEMHLIMPAFGALTGGMAADDQAIETVVGGPAEAVIGLGQQSLHFPLGFAPRCADNAGQTQFDFLQRGTAANA